MIDGRAFQTRARIVDHLGREQIADCPTAISELWKNAFDAYARSVQLNIYDGEEPAAAIVDDGHGMNLSEFLERWLTVGTESKATTETTPVVDRNGLRTRPRQGQKGIGRLSCANLGSTLLLISKRKRDPFVGALIDWRMFENPFINLSDILIPFAEFTEPDHIFAELPNLIARLTENVTGGADKQRRRRIRQAWRTFDELLDEDRRGTDGDVMPPSKELLHSISRLPFEPRHLEDWSVWTGSCRHGTALLISDINYDLRVQLNDRLADATAQAAKTRFFETLSSFVDPFVDPTDRVAHKNDPQFSYAVSLRDIHRIVVGTEKQFDKRQVDDMEHRIEGHVDAHGTFSGRVKAFGRWLPDTCTIEPPKDLTLPRRRDSVVGPFDLYIASMEFTSANTTHTAAEFQRYRELAQRYSGFMVFRDGLRVLPYGRTDNDFFEIESRRSKSAGREFWNHRQMFGRLAITRRQNPNLKDKAGREGILDNRAAKTLKELVANILMQSARLYFGSASELRNELLPQISAENRRQRAAEATTKLRQRHRRDFRTKLRAYTRDLPKFIRQVENYANQLQIDSEREISGAQSAIAELQCRLSEFELPAAPTNLESLAEQYANFQYMIQAADTAITDLSKKFYNRIEELKPTEPEVLLEKQTTRLGAEIHRRIRAWKTTIDALQKAEFHRIQEIVGQRGKLFQTEAQPLLHRFTTGELTYIEVSKLLDLLKQRMEEENRELFVPYIGALESLHDSVDLEYLATFGVEQVGELREELERLNSLAQLGIAVEIVGHELQAYDDIIGSALSRLPVHVRRTKAAKDIELGYEGLTDQLRFLSPLRLAGPKVQRWITGNEIVAYVSEFFRFTLAKNRITLSATDRFRTLRVFDQRSRLYPVFINLVNNSIYWLAVTDRPDRQILFDVLESQVVVSDNGPGVEPGDVASLFSLFFTRKTRGGRGVGLYLCRANLTAGGHTIRYEPRGPATPPDGANFFISFRGVEFNGD